MMRSVLLAPLEIAVYSIINSDMGGIKVGLVTFYVETMFAIFFPSKKIAKNRGTSVFPLGNSNV